MSPEPDLVASVFEDVLRRHFEPLESYDFPVDFKGLVRSLEQDLLLAALEITPNRAQAAKLLGILRTTFVQMEKKFNQQGVTSHGQRT